MLKCPTIYFIILVTLAMAMSALAQQPIKDAKAYRLGPRDVLFIEVLNRGQKEFEARLVVSDQGSINVPLMGSVQAAGLTIPELEKNYSSLWNAIFLWIPRYTFPCRNTTALAFSLPVPSRSRVCMNLTSSPR